MAIFSDESIAAFKIRFNLSIYFDFSFSTLIVIKYSSAISDHLCKEIPGSLENFWDNLEQRPVGKIFKGESKKSSTC